MVEIFAIDDAHRAVVETKLAFVLVRNHRNRFAAMRGDNLQRHRTESAGRAPDQHDVAFFDRIGFPAHQHAIGGRGAQHVAGGLFPGQRLGFGLALVGLGLGELAIGAVIGLILPNAHARRQHWISS